MGIIPEKHSVELLLNKTGLEQTLEGARLRLTAHVTCKEFCDLRGLKVILTGPDDAPQALELTRFNGAENRTEEIEVVTPAKKGTYEWEAVFPGQTVGDCPHLESRFTFSYAYRPHYISVLVWDLPAAVGEREAFCVKIGAKCAAGCSLAGGVAEIYDGSGALTATCVLGETPLQGTAGLYWAEAALTAASAGTGQWRVVMRTPEEAAHASHTFQVPVVPVADCLVTVHVKEAAADVPIPGATVTLHPFRAVTDLGGTARLHVPKGQYKLFVSSQGAYQTLRGEQMVNGDMETAVSLDLKEEDRGDF